MVRTAILGLGKVAEQIHLPACQLVNELELVAGCEPGAERRELMKAKFELPAVYEDATELLEKERPELVIIGTPPDSHKKLTLLALRNGADVLCEKPFVMSVAEADEVIDAARRMNKIVAVNNQYRYMNTYRTAKEHIASGDTGRLFFVQCWQQMFHPPAFEQGSWRAALKQSTLFEFGSHPLDLICHFFGALPEAVTAHIPRVRSEYDSDVLVQMTLRFPDERLATLALNRVSNAPERYLEMRLDCEKASMRISLGGVARASVEMCRHHGRNLPIAKLSFVRGGEARIERDGKSTVIATEKQPAFASATAAHLRKILADKKNNVPAISATEHARNILRIIFAGYESARTGNTERIQYATDPSGVV